MDIEKTIEFEAIRDVPKNDISKEESYSKVGSQKKIELTDFQEDSFESEPTSYPRTNLIKRKEIQKHTLQMKEDAYPNRRVLTTIHPEDKEDEKSVYEMNSAQDVQIEQAHKEDNFAVCKATLLNEKMNSEEKAFVTAKHQVGLMDSHVEKGLADEKLPVEVEYELYTLINDAKNGPAVVFWKDGTKEDRYYIDNILHGPMTLTYSDGSLLEATYVEGKLTGAGIKYYVNGDQEKLYLVDGKRQGLSITHKDNGDRLEIYWRDDIYEGKATYFWADGTREERIYINGVANGPGTILWPNGKQENRHYINGYLEGEATVIFPNGDMKKMYYEKGIKK